MSCGLCYMRFWTWVHLHSPKLETARSKTNMKNRFKIEKRCQFDVQYPVTHSAYKGGEWWKFTHLFPVRSVVMIQSSKHGGMDHHVISKICSLWYLRYMEWYTWNKFATKNTATLLWSVLCVVDSWSRASPGLSQTDWTLGLGGAALAWVYPCCLARSKFRSARQSGGYDRFLSQEFAKIWYPITERGGTERRWRVLCDRRKLVVRSYGSNMAAAEAKLSLQVTK